MKLEIWKESILNKKYLLKSVSKLSVDLRYYLGLTAIHDYPGVVATKNRVIQPAASYRIIEFFEGYILAILSYHDWQGHGLRHQQEHLTTTRNSPLINALGVATHFQRKLYNGIRRYLLGYSL